MSSREVFASNEYERAVRDALGRVFGCTPRVFMRNWYVVEIRGEPVGYGSCTYFDACVSALVDAGRRDALEGSSVPWNG